MLDAKQHQGKFGDDYVRVLASAAGLIVLKDDLDADGIDLGFRATGRYGRVYSPTIEAQIKTWSKPSGSSGHLIWVRLFWRDAELVRHQGVWCPG